MMRLLLIGALAYGCLVADCLSFQAAHIPHHQRRAMRRTVATRTHLSVNVKGDHDRDPSERSFHRSSGIHRQFKMDGLRPSAPFHLKLIFVLSALSFGVSTTPPSMAAEKAPLTVYISGKRPQVPGKKAPDKSDVSGTRKDPSFLRSISDCKNQCENKAGPDGLAKSKEDCLSECQDICCTTYEQCTFSIVPRI